MMDEKQFETLLLELRSIKKEIVEKLDEIKDAVGDVQTEINIFRQEV